MPTWCSKCGEELRSTSLSCGCNCSSGTAGAGVCYSGGDYVLTRCRKCGSAIWAPEEEPNPLCHRCFAEKITLDLLEDLRQGLQKVTSSG